MRIPEAGPLGEAFFEARERAMTGALLVKRSLGGCVESVVTVRTQRLLALALFWAADFFCADGMGKTDDRLRGCPLVALEVLDSTFVFFGFLFAREGAEVAAFTGGWVLLAGVEAVFAGLKFADHTGGDAGGWEEEACLQPVAGSPQCQRSHPGDFALFIRVDFFGSADLRQAWHEHHVAGDRHDEAGAG